MKSCHDWSEIVNDLFRKGYTNKTLSESVGASPQLFTMIRSGVRGHHPTYEVGKRLVDLWTENHIPNIHNPEVKKPGELTRVEDMNLKSIV